jgi:hypothetical protein
VRSDITPGGVLPDYSLPDRTGTDRTLGEFQGADPLILGATCVPHRPRSARTGTSARPACARAWTAGDWSPSHGWDRPSRDAVPSG